MLIQKINKIVPITDGHYVPTFRTVQGRANIYSHVEKILEDFNNKRFYQFCKVGSFASKLDKKEIARAKRDLRNLKLRM